MAQSDIDGAKQNMDVAQQDIELLCPLVVFWKDGGKQNIDTVQPNIDGG